MLQWGGRGIDLGGGAGLITFPGVLAPRFLVLILTWILRCCGLIASLLESAAKWGGSREIEPEGAFGPGFSSRDPPRNTSLDDDQLVSEIRDIVG